MADLSLIGDSNLNSYLSSLNGSNRDAATIATLQATQQQAFEISSTPPSYTPPTDDLEYMSRDIDEKIQANLETSDRQFEINEWSNNNKLDTLFFMQILFICLTFISTMMFLKLHDYITPYVFTITSIIAAIIACGTLILRARYTSVVRDSRYWHKARFPSVPNAFPVHSYPLS